LDPAEHLSRLLVSKLFCVKELLQLALLGGSSPLDELLTQGVIGSVSRRVNDKVSNLCGILR
jgi:hypothetical protein